MNLEALRQEEQQLMDLLTENRNKQREINKAAFIQKHGVDIGDLVEWHSSKGAKRGVISKIEFSGLNPSYYYAFIVNADGKVCKREVRIWSFEMYQFQVIKKEQSK